jgi:hypothetical protein
MQLNMTFDPVAFRNSLDDLGKRVFPKALANLLNEAAFESRRELDAAIVRHVDRPNNFTRKAWNVVKARYQDGDHMFTRIEAKPAQSKYIWYIVSGDERHAGDPGTGRWDILWWSHQPTAVGGAYKPSYVQRIVKQHKDERALRQSLRAQRSSFAGPGPMPDAMKWVTASRNRPGEFFGEIGGVKGYFKRPERYTKKQRDAAIGLTRRQPGHISSAGPRGGSNMPWTKPGSKPQLLLAFKDQTQYRALFSYNAVIGGVSDRIMSVPRLNHWLADARAWQLANRP